MAIPEKNVFSLHPNCHVLRREENDALRRALGFEVGGKEEERTSEAYMEETSLGDHQESEFDGRCPQALEEEEGCLDCQT